MELRSFHRKLHMVRYICVRDKLTDQNTRYNNLQNKYTINDVHKNHWLVLLIREKLNL